MIKIYYTLLLLGLGNGLCAMETNAEFDKYVQLPSQKEIASRLNTLKLQDFVTKTKIDYDLGDKKEHPLSIDCAVACALFKYENTPSTKQLNIALAQQKRPEIISAILQDHPKAIQYIKEAEETAAKLMLTAKENKKKT
jgi:hypothetical protein